MFLKILEYFKNTGLKNFKNLVSNFKVLIQKLNF